MKIYITIALLIASVIGHDVCASQAGPYIKYEYDPVAAQNLPRLKYGFLTLHNMLNEPIDFSFETSINAADPEREIRIINGDKKAKGSGTIPAQTTQELRSYPHSVLDKTTQKTLPIFGGIVLLRLKRQAEQNAAGYTGRVEEPGIYDINIDDSGNLTFDKQATETDTKANQ